MDCTYMALLEMSLEYVSSNVLPVESGERFDGVGILRKDVYIYS